MNITEEELVYNYRIGREEALDFLFLIYEKKVTPFLKNNDYVFKINGYDYEDKKAFVRRCLYVSVRGYCFSFGNLNNYYSAIASRDIASLYRKIKGTYDEGVYYNSISLSDVEVEERISCSDSVSHSIDSDIILEKIRNVGEKEYKIIKLYMAGNTYIQIGKKLNIKPKAVSNYIQKIRTKFRKNKI